MSDAELEEKFKDCAAPVLGEARAASVFRTILELDKDSELPPLMAQIDGKER